MKPNPNGHSKHYSRVVNRPHKSPGSQCRDVLIPPTKRRFRRSERMVDYSSLCQVFALQSLSTVFLKWVCRKNRSIREMDCFHFFDNDRSNASFMLQ